MTESKKQNIADKAKQKPKTEAELSDTDLNKASGGAFDAFRSITDGTHSSGGGGGAGLGAHIWVDKKADGSV